MSHNQTIEAKPVKATITRQAHLSPTTTAKPQVAVRVRLVSYPQKARRAKSRRMEALVCQGLLGMVVAVMSYGISTISGQVMVEQSRREEQRAKTTTLNALRTATDLRSHLQSITNPESISTWAFQHQFSKPGEVQPKSDRDQGLLALRD